MTSYPIALLDTLPPRTHRLDLLYSTVMPRTGDGHEVEDAVDRNYIRVIDAFHCLSMYVPRQSEGNQINYKP